MSNCKRRLLGVASIVAAAAALHSAALADQPAAEPPAMTPEQAREVESAQTVEELVEMGKLFFLRRQMAAAQACVVRISELDPESLTDDRRQSPKSWHDFWFAQRAAIQERALAEDDASGRVKLALWLHEAGVTEAARQMLTAALEIDESLPEGQELAERWRLFAGGPVRFDLRYGLTQPLLLEEYTDQGVELMLRRDRIFLVLPFAYEPAEGRLIINRSLLRVMTDDGKAGIMKGIALLSATGGIAALPGDDRSSASPAGMQLQPGSEPLWERLEVERNADGEIDELACFNTVHPIVPRQPGVARAPAPAPRDRTGAPGGRETRPASGYAAFIVELPQAFSHLDCEYRGMPPVRLEAELLAALATPVDTAGPVPERLLEFLIGQASADQPAVAAAAVGKLAQMNAQVESQAPSLDAVASAQRRQIDTTLLAAMAHADRVTRRTAFDALVGSRELPPDTLDQIRTFPHTEALMGMLDLMRKELEAPAAADPHRPHYHSAMQGGDAMAGAVAALPPSQAAPNCFAVLAACLDHQETAVRARTLDLLLASPTQQGVQALVSSGRAARQETVARLAEMTDPVLKEALLRALLATADPEMMMQLLAASEDISLTISSENDPILAAVIEQQSGPVLEQLAALLARSDLSAVADSSGFRRVMETLAAHQNTPEGRSGLLKLALAQFDTAYEPPVRRERGAGGIREQESAIEEMLASLACGPDAAAARSAAAALVSAGRIEALKTRLPQATTARRQDLVQFLARENQLWEREALPMLLAGMLGDQDPRTVQLALASLAVIENGVDARERWRVRMAVKEAVSSDVLLPLTDHDDQRIAQQAVDLLNRLTQSSAGSAGDFRAMPDQEARRDSLASMEADQAGWPAGPYACMVYLDVRPTASPPPAGIVARNSVPLTAGPLVLQRSPAGNLVVLMDGNPIASLPQPEEGLKGSLRIDAAPILRAALDSPQAQREGLAGRVDLVWLNRPRECELKYGQFGGWSGEAEAQEHETMTGPARPLRISGARIVLEPLAP